MHLVDGTKLRVPVPTSGLPGAHYGGAPLSVHRFDAAVVMDAEDLAPAKVGFKSRKKRKEKTAGNPGGGAEPTGGAQPAAGTDTAKVPPFDCSATACTLSLKCAYIYSPLFAMLVVSRHNQSRRCLLSLACSSRAHPTRLPCPLFLHRRRRRRRRKWQRRC